MRMATLVSPPGVFARHTFDRDRDRRRLWGSARELMHDIRRVAATYSIPLVFFFRVCVPSKYSMRLRCTLHGDDCVFRAEELRLTVSCPVLYPLYCTLAGSRCFHAVAPTKLTRTKEK